MTIDISTIGIAVDTGGLERGQKALKDTENAANRTADAADKTSTHFKSLSSAIDLAKNAMAAYLSLQTVKVFVQTADAIALMDARLKLATKSTTEFVQAQKDVFSIAQRNSAGLQEVASLYSKLSDPIRRVGGATEHVAGIVDAFTKTLKISGANAAEAASATRQFGQAMGSGRLAGEEFTAMAEANPRFLQAMADGMGVPIGKLKEMGSEGKLTTEIVGTELLKSLQKLTAEAKTMPDTVGNAFTRLKNEAQIAIDAINKQSNMTLGLSGVIDTAAQLIPAIRDELAGAFQAVGVWITDNKTALGETWETVKALAGDVWEVAKAGASVLGAIIQWDLQSGIVKTTLESMRLLIAGFQDGVEFIGAAFATVGSIILRTVLTPLQWYLDGIAKVQGFLGNSDSAKAYSDAANSIREFAGAGSKYGDEVVAKFARGESAVGRLNAEMANGKVATDAVGKSVESVNGNFKKLKDAATDAKAVKAVADEYAKLSAEIAKQLALSQAELDGNGKLEASEKYRITTLEKLIEQYQAGKITLKEYIDLESKMNDVQGVMEKAEAQAKAAKAAQAAYAESLQYQDDVNKALREEEDARNRIRLAVGANTVAAEEAQQLAQLEMQTVFASAEDRKRILDYYRIELDLRKKIAAINSAGGIDQAERDRLIAIEAENAARLKGVADMGAAMQSTTSIWQSIDQTAHTVWTNVLQGGQDVWSKLKNTAKSVFFDWLYQMTLKKWIFSIGASVTGSGAMAQTASSAGNLSSLGSSMGWLTDFGGSATNQISKIGGSIGGDFGQSIITNAPEIGSAMQTLGDGLGYLNAVMAASKGQWGTALGSAIGTYFGGPIGAFIGSKIGGWIDKSFGGATKPSIEGGFSNSGNPGTNGRAYTDGVGGMYYGGSLDSGAYAMVTGAGTDYNRIVKASGHMGGTLTGQAFMGIDGNNGAKGSQNKLDYAAFLNGNQIYNRGVDLGTNNAGNTQESMTSASKEANTKTILAALAATDLGPALNKYLDSVKINGASLEEVTASLGDVTNYISVNNAIKNLPFPYLTDMSVEASKALIAAAGGIENLGTNIGTYLDLFGTEAEKTAALTGNLSDGFNAIGSTMPAANAGLREWYKSEVARLGAMDLGVEANAKAYAGALKLASGVDALAKAEEQAAATKQSWQDQLNVLTGKTTDTALQMQRDLASTTDESTQALIRAVYAEKDRQKAMSESATAMQKMATDQAAAAQKSADAYKSALSAQQSYYASLTSAGDAVRNLLAGLKTGVNAGTSPQSRLDAARAQYLQDLSAARGGDFAAYNRVATTAQTYIGAGSDMYASSAEQKAILAQVQSELQNLPAVSQYDANLAQLKAIEAAIKDGATNTVGAIQSQQFDTLAAINSMTATLSSSFGSIDANGNGLLTFEELKAALGTGDTLTQQLINAIDTNGDGQIDKLEVIAANTKGLAELDRINSTINQFDWSDANKPAAIAGFSNIAKQNNWSVAQIAAASGYSTSEISRLFAGTGVGTGVGGSPTSVSEQIDAAIKQYDWSDAAKQASAAAFANIASSKGWSIGQIAGVSGYNASDLSRLFAGTALGTGVAYGAISSSTGIAADFVTGGGGASAGGASSDAAISGAVGALDWSNPSASAAALANQAYWNNWSQAEIAASTGYNLSDIQALFANAGIPAFANGGAFTNGIVTRPTAFNMAQMGEAGSEAIMPLTNIGGRLGVYAAGGNNDALIAEVRELRKEVAKSKGEDAPIHLHIMGADGKTMSEIVIRDVKERSRRGEKLIFQAGIAQ